MGNFRSIDGLHRLPKSMIDSEVMVGFLVGNGGFFEASSMGCTTSDCTTKLGVVSWVLELLGEATRGDLDLLGDGGCETITYPLFSVSDAGVFGEPSSTSIDMEPPCSSLERFPSIELEESLLVFREGGSSTRVASVSFEESVPPLSASSSSSSREVTSASLARSIVGVTAADSQYSNCQNRSAS